MLWRCHVSSKQVHTKRARPKARAPLHAGLVTLSVGSILGALVGLLLLLLRRQLGQAFTDDPAVLAVSRLQTALRILSRVLVQGAEHPAVVSVSSLP